MKLKESPFRLLVVTGNYPSAVQPACGAFVQSFVHAMVDAGAEAEVVHPISVLSRLRGPYPSGGVDQTPGKHHIPLHRPLHASFSMRNLGFMNTAVLTQAGFEYSVMKTLRSISGSPTLAYGHFLYSAGRAAVRAGKKLAIPSFVAVGEGTFWTVDPMGYERARRDFAAATGFLAVSTPIRNGLRDSLGIPEEKIAIFPNGVDLTMFRPLNRGECRRRLGIAEDQFIVAFVGTFDNLKGGLNLLQAASGLAGTKLMLIGNGPVMLDSQEVIFRGQIPHDRIPEYLSAADIFVLPTLEEGSCNAVIEAMACGLPVITSTGAYMDDIVKDSVAIRVDPNDIAAIRQAIIRLYDNPELRSAMATAALEHSRAFDIRQRAIRVLQWMAGRIELHHDINS